MAIKAGQILHVMNQFVVDRIQTAGPGDLNIPQEKVFELGNYQSVGIVRDVPDLSFNLECLDVSTEVEALLVGADPEVAGPVTYDLANNVTVDILSPWKTPYGQFNAVNGVVIPCLTLESASYRYGLQENAGETFTLSGDSIYYTPGTPWQDLYEGDGTETDFDFENGPALPYVEGGTTFHALSVSVNGVRLTQVPAASLASYTTAGDTSVYAPQATATTGIALAVAPAIDARVSITYASADVGAYPQAGTTPFTTNVGPVHQGATVKPAAIRGKDIDVYFNGVRWGDVQSATVEWRLTLEEDYEFGNARAVSRDATDVPAVTGAIELRPRNVEAFFARLRQLTGVGAGAVIGPQSSVAAELRIELRNPESGGTSAQAAGVVLKVLEVGAARFTIPGYSGQVQQKLNVTVNYESDTGVLHITKPALGAVKGVDPTGP